MYKQIEEGGEGWSCWIFPDIPLTQTLYLHLWTYLKFITYKEVYVEQHIQHTTIFHVTSIVICKSWLCIHINYNQMYNIHMYIQVIFYLFGRCKETDDLFYQPLVLLPSPPRKNIIVYTYKHDFVCPLQIIYIIHTYLQP